jgi:hypothetical protein
MQDHEIQPLLTVWEAMYFSASLKIGDEKSRAERKIIVSILKTTVQIKKKNIINFINIFLDKTNFIRIRTV